MTKPDILQRLQRASELRPRPPQVLNVAQTLVGLELQKPGSLPDLRPEHFLLDSPERALWVVCEKARRIHGAGVQLPIIVSMAEGVDEIVDAGGADYIHALRSRASGSAPDLVRMLKLAWLKRMEAKCPPDDEGIPAERQRVEEEYGLALGHASRFLEPFQLGDPAELPPREFLYGAHHIRRYVSATYAPGGVGKSALVQAEALAMATGLPLLGVQPDGRLRVAYWNGEDPDDENRRRFAAIAKHYGLRPEQVDGSLFVGSGRTREIVLVEQGKDGIAVREEVVDAVTEYLAGNEIDVLIVDPLVSTHRASENDNTAMDRVVKTWARIAEAANCSVELVHHTRKTGGGEIGVEDGRGGVAVLAGARSARVLNPMTQEEASRGAVQNRRAYFRVDNGKANMAPPSGRSDWFHFVSVSLGNGGLEGGDSVGVVTRWEFPRFEATVSEGQLVEIQERIAVGAYRADAQAKAWAGTVVADVMGLDLGDPAQKRWAKDLIQLWLTSGALREVDRKNERRELKTFIEVGAWGDDRAAR